MQDILKIYNVKVFGLKSALTPIVFMHGFGTNQDIWSQIIPIIRGYRQCITFDNAGAYHDGQIPYDIELYKNFDGYVSDLLQIIDALQLSSVNIVAASLASVTAFKFSVEHPDRVKSVVTIGASPRYMNDISTKYVGGFTQESLAGMLGYMKTNYEDWVRAFCSQTKAIDPSEKVVNQLLHNLLNTDPDISYHISESMLRADFRHLLPLVPCPVLLLYSRNDMSVPMSVSLYLEQNMPQAKLVVLVGALGHFPHVTNSDQVASELFSFFDE